MNEPAVLVVDDDRETCAMLQEALSMRRFSVRWRSDPSEALRWLHESSGVDVVLTDLRMGKWNGLALCQAIHAIDPGLPVVISTAFGDRAMAEQATRVGACDLIAKPFDLERLADVLRRAASARVPRRR